jgi:hypothetical protein
MLTIGILNSMPEMAVRSTELWDFYLRLERFSCKRRRAQVALRSNSTRGGTHDCSEWVISIVPLVG